MLVVNVCYVATAMKNSELHVVVDVTVKYVRRIVGEECRRGFRRRRQSVRSSATWCFLTTAWWCIEGGRRRARRLQTGVRRFINQHRRISDGPCTQEELFKFAIDAVAHRTDTDSVRINFSSDAARSVVDRKRII